MFLLMSFLSAAQAWDLDYHNGLLLVWRLLL